MKQIFVVAVLVFVSMQVMAGHFNEIGNTISKSEMTTLRSDITSDRDQAYRYGHQLKTDLESQDPKALQRTFMLPSVWVVRDSIQLDNSYVTVNELSRTQGKLEYQAQLHVEYHYLARDSNK